MNSSLVQASQRGIPILVDAERKREGLDDLLNLSSYVICSAKFPQACVTTLTVASLIVPAILFDLII